MTEDQTARLLILLAGAFPELGDGGKATVVSWHIALADLDYSLAERATVMVLQRAKFRPRPADIREAVDTIRPKRAPAADEAWEEVVRQMNAPKLAAWSHPIVQRAVRIMGFDNLVHSNYPAKDREQFFKIYETLAKRGETETAVLTASNVVGLVAIGDMIKPLCGRVG